MRPSSDPVTGFFDSYPAPVPDLARRLRDLIRSVLPDANEELDRPGRVVGYSYAPGYAGLICTIILSKTGVKLGIIGSAQLPDPLGLLEGSGKQHRYVAFSQQPDFDRPGIKELLRSAAARREERAGKPTAAKPHRAQRNP